MVLFSVMSDQPKNKIRHKTKSRSFSVRPETILLIKQIFIGLLVFSVVGLIVTGVWYGTRMNNFTITEVVVSGGSTIDKSEVRELALDELKDTYFGLVPKQFIYFYPHDQILTAVNKVERIKDVVVKRLDSQTITITYNEYSPDALWCKVGTAGECLFLDENGYAFAQAPELEGSSLLRYYNLQTPPTKGQSIADEADYLASRYFSDQLASDGWFINQIEIDAVRDVFYTLEQGGEIKATLKEEVEKTLSHLNTIRQSKEFKHLKPGNFQYIDLRFGTKIFVNEKLETKEEQETATSTEDLIEPVSTTTE